MSDFNNLINAFALMAIKCKRFKMTIDSSKITIILNLKDMDRLYFLSKILPQFAMYLQIC